MGLFFDRFTREPKKEIDKNAPPKKGIALFFTVLKREFWGICVLNLLFILFSLPVVTIPAAITAMSKVVSLMLMDKPVYIFSEFIGSLKADWKRATAVGFVYFPLIAAALYGQFIYAYAMEIYFMHIAALLLCALLVAAGFYVFPMIAILDISIVELLRNSILLTFLRFHYNLLVLFILAALVYGVLMLFPTSVFIVLLIFFSLTNLITTFCAYTGIKKYVLK